MEIEKSKQPTDREKVLARLDAIGEEDPACRNEVLDACAKDSEAREYYVQMAKEEKQ